MLKLIRYMATQTLPLFELNLNNRINVTLHRTYFAPHYQSRLSSGEILSYILRNWFPNTNHNKASNFLLPYKLVPTRYMNINSLMYNPNSGLITRLEIEIILAKHNHSMLTNFNHVPEATISTHTNSRIFT